MSTKKLKKPKQKAVSLQEFTASLEPTTPSAGQNIIYAPKKPMISSWADEVEEYELITEKERIVLPSAPRAARGPAYEDGQIPRVPPYKAHLGNISYDIADEEVFRFFNGLVIDELRLPRDSNNRLRGFGYVEFRNREDLIEALIMNEQVLRGRPIRISLGIGHGDGAAGSGRKGPVDETPADWRAGGGHGMSMSPPDFGRGGQSSFYPTRTDFNSGRRDYGGSKPDFYNRRSDYGNNGGRPFENSSQGRNNAGYDRPPSGGGYSNDFYGGRGDGPPQRGRFTPKQEYDHQNRDFGGYTGNGNSRGGFYGQGERDRGDFYRSPSRSSEDLVRPPTQPRIILRGAGPPPHFPHNENKERVRADSGDSEMDRTVSPTSTSPSSPPRERKKLVLQPRSKTTPDSENVTVNASIFGGAKPVDTSAREREIEKKLTEMTLVETKKLRILHRPKPEVIAPPTDVVQKKPDMSQRFRRDSNNSRFGPPPLMAEPSSPPRLFTQQFPPPRRRRSEETERDKDTNSEPEDERDLRFIEFHRVDHRKGRSDGSVPGVTGGAEWRGQRSGTGNPGAGKGRPRIN